MLNGLVLQNQNSSYQCSLNNCTLQATILQSLGGHPSGQRKPQTSLCEGGESGSTLQWESLCWMPPSCHCRNLFGPCPTNVRALTSFRLNSRDWDRLGVCQGSHGEGMN